MRLEERLENVSIIGGSGKMGSGIGALILQQVGKLRIREPEKVYKVNLIDINERGLLGVYRYIKAQLTKYAEKSIVELRELYKERKDLVENSEIISAFVDESLQCLRWGSDLEMAKGSKVVFEAIVEDEDVKVKVFKDLKEIVGEGCIFFTNTSSIPIGYLESEANLYGKIMGYHFYNPPIVQRLVEIISTPNTSAEVKAVAEELGKLLRKKLIPSNDVAGFIGNGYFMRDGLYALKRVEKLQPKYGFAGAVYLINKISQEWLVRPMGIFQLIDYVGIDVFQCILRVMSKHLQDSTLHSPIIDQLLKKNIKGGQNEDGTQKEGFFKYEGLLPVGVYDFEKGEYILFQELKSDELEKELGRKPESWRSWKEVVRERSRDEFLTTYFKELHNLRGMGRDEAINYLKKSKEIGTYLVTTGVANSSEDVNAVLMNGFFMAYGPINEYV